MVQDMLLCEVLWRIAHGIDASDEDTACPPVSAEFESRLVTKRGAKKRKGILGYWQHGAGVEARRLACTCIKRNATAISAGVKQA